MQLDSLYNIKFIIKAHKLPGSRKGWAEFDNFKDVTEFINHLIDSRQFPGADKILIGASAEELEDRFIRICLGGNLAPEIREKGEYEMNYKTISIIIQLWERNG